MMTASIILVSMEFAKMDIITTRATVITAGLDIIVILVSKRIS